MTKITLLNVLCLKDYRIRSFLSIWLAHGDLCKHLGIESRSVLESIPKCLHKSYINAHTGYLK